MLEKVTAAIVKIMHCDASDIAPESNLIELGIDSLKAINILFELEEEFGIDIPNERIAEIETVNDIMDCIRELQEAQAA